METGDMGALGARFVQALQAALQARGLYGPAHPLTADAVTAAHAALTEALASRPNIAMGAVGNYLVFDRQPLHGLAGGGQGLMACMLRAKAEKVVFGRSVRRDELVEFLALLSAFVNSERKETDALDTSGMPHILIEGIGPGTGSESESKASDEAVRVCATDCAKGVEVLGDIARSLGDGQSINASAASGFVGRILERAIENSQSLMIAASLKKHDQYSFVHSTNVAVLSLIQAQGLGLHAPLPAGIGMAGFLHDTGKLALAGHILRKKEKLTDEEFDQVRQHPLDGAKILALTPDIHPVVAQAAFEHHVRYDTTGYPRKVFGDLSLAGMIVAIADVYDAMRSERAYRAGMAPERVYQEMRGMAGTHFHPDLLDAFFKTVGVYPPGTLVELDDGHIGMVVAANAAERTRPMVEVFYRKGSGSVRNPHVVDVSERAREGGYRRAIVRSVPMSEGYAIPPRYRLDGQQPAEAQP
jgi:HD-GYP domain-containing protein (c-di-GMP phosphodiesterase class II)